MQKLANAIQNAILEIATSEKNSDQLSPIVQVEVVVAKWWCKKSVNKRAFWNP